MRRSFRIYSTAKPNSNSPSTIVCQRFSICHDCAAPFEIVSITAAGSSPGRVTLGRDACVWFGAVLRGDANDIAVGDRSNILDTAVVRIDADAPATIVAGVSVGHGATVHGCTVGDCSLISIGATILSHAVTGTRAYWLGGHALGDASFLTRLRRGASPQTH